MGVGGKEIRSVDSRQQCIWDNRVMQTHHYSVCGRVPLIHRKAKSGKYKLKHVQDGIVKKKSN